VAQQEFGAIIAAKAYFLGVNRLEFELHEGAIEIIRGILRARTVQNKAKLLDLWSVRVTLDIRAVGYREGDIIEWAWIGAHNEFDKVFG
jgi:hypothetical protein